MSDGARRWLTALVLAAVTVGAYAGVRHCDFVVWDDFAFVVDNEHVNDGLTTDGIIGIATTLDLWAPLTWLSHALDVEIWGLRPSGHHATSLLLHVINVILLLLVFERLTGWFWPSVFAAAVFALHPLNVESVAWIAERKNVLSGMFWLLALGAWVSYAQGRGRRWYALTIVFFALGLMSKGSPVTLPFVLLLLDFWPLRRLRLFDRRAGGKGPAARAEPGGRSALFLVAEKLPLFALAAASCLVTYLAQRAVGAVADLSAWDRFANPVVSYVIYARRMVWPVDLAALYPLLSLVGGTMWSLPQVIGAAGFLILVSVGCLVLRRRHPYVPVGWFWFLGVLVPMIGIVQVGPTAMADRHMYLPMMGLLLAAAGALSLASRWRSGAWITSAAAVVAIAALGTQSAREIPHWRNTLTLFERIVAQTSDNYQAMNNLAWLLATCPDDAVRDGPRAVRLAARACQITDYKDPEYVDTLAAAYAEVGRFEDAVATETMAIGRLVELGNMKAIPAFEQRRLWYRRGMPVRSDQGCPRR